MALVLVSLSASAGAQDRPSSARGHGNPRPAAYLDLGLSGGRQWGTVGEFDRTLAETKGRKWVAAARLGLRFTKGERTLFVVANEFAVGRSSLEAPRVVNSENFFLGPTPRATTVREVWPIQPYGGIYPFAHLDAYFGASVGIGWQQLPEWADDSEALAVRVAVETGYEWKMPTLE